MELNCFKDLLFGLLNDWAPDILDIMADDRQNTFWMVMGDGSVFRIRFEKEGFTLFKPPAEV